MVQCKVWRHWMMSYNWMCPGGHMVDNGDAACPELHTWHRHWCLTIGRCLKCERRRRRISIQIFNNITGTVPVSPRYWQHVGQGNFYFNFQLSMFRQTIKELALFIIQGKYIFYPLFNVFALIKVSINTFKADILQCFNYLQNSHFL